MAHGGNWQFRYEFGTMQNNVTRSIRASRGHSQNTGVGDDVLPAVDDICYVGHATSRAAAGEILAYGPNRQQRLHVHFYQCDRYGELVGGSISPRAEVLIVAPSTNAREEGIVFYRSSNKAIFHLVIMQLFTHYSYDMCTNFPI